MNEAYMNPLELYMKRSFKLIVMLVPFGLLCASLTFTVLKLSGLYPMVLWAELMAFDIMDLVFLAIGVLLVRHCEADTGELKPRALRHGKIYVAMVALIQWNFISYIIPSSDFWAYAPFFTMFVVAFLDAKFVAMFSGGLIASLALSWALTGGMLLPVRNILFVPNVILRVVLLVLAEGFLWLLTWLIQSILVRDIEGMAAHDPLTRLRNRRSLYKCIGDLKQKEKPFSVLMCDLDDFKLVNDTYGHECGDKVLQSVADTIRRNVGETDIVFRYGGEEILILVDGDMSAAGETAERIRRAVMNGSVLYGEESIAGTVTIGAAEYAPGLTDEAFIDVADRRLYVGKQRGKNCVVCE